jgi:ComF family protein
MESIDCVCSGKKFDGARLLSIFKFGYGGSADKFIYVLKRKSNKRFFDFAEDELYKRLLSEEKLMLTDFSQAYFVNVPRSRRSILEYGFDHAELLAKGVAARIGGEYIHAIGRYGVGRTQKKLDSEARSKNVSGKFVYDEDKDLGGKNVVLIDDVVTTGATVAEAIRVLRENNAGEITVLCLARTGNSDKKKNKKH